MIKQLIRRLLGTMRKVAHFLIRRTLRLAKVQGKTPTEVIMGLDVDKAMSDTFECEMCHGTFDTEWTDEEANAEALKQFGVEDASEDAGMARICDDCYSKLATHYGWEDTT